MQEYNWYSTLIKPDWAPQSTVFGPVWTFLYILILISFVILGYMYYKKEIKFGFLTPLLLNIFFNLIFTPIQFGLKNNILALVDIIFIIITLVWFLCKVYRVKQIVFVLLLPYLLWVLFAFVLQSTITYLNF